MTIDKTLNGIKAAIENADSVTYNLIEGLPVYVSQEDDTVDYPCIKVTDTGSEEHEVLRGVYDPLTVDVSLCTIPHADSEGDDYTEEEHQAASNQLYNLMANTDMITLLNNETGLRVFDIRTESLVNEREDGKNVATITQAIVCCLDN